ncbi:Winged helix-turn-helix transcription repressor DNA-binding [Penicillium angulare]|uniref:Winged helix-turn-helix transcription repressor DNA-binding n=1 Tax=Penicillium angulare TaxID=116970 RepID=UPI0025401892|nr:Winged helix-turn-helix transcription repressor DNA-binding [Penicillium angulare]KAJ5281144.1 Winged helix-turn-helix transcription repressor DNA-binding [Penicillium angulare]
MGASMKIQAGQTAYINQAVSNGYSNEISQEQVLLTSHPGGVELERPVKRLRTSDHSTSLLPSAPLNPEAQSQPLTPKVIDKPSPIERYATNWLSEFMRRDGEGINTPVSSTSASLASSFDPRKSTSAPTTPEQASSTPVCVEGMSILQSGKVDIDKCRPRSSIPTRLSPALYGRQCVASAYASRLDPYALHPKEQQVLQDILCHMHSTVYLNIRNGILRLWTRNAMVSVTREEALGCAKDYRWMNLASFAYDWLARYGYINFGCVEVPMPLVPPRRGRRREGPVIVVIGAGVGGLGCARQLEGLFHHYRDAETSPRVIVLEGRRRIGGRIYSHPLHSMKSEDLPSGLVPKAEMGAQIIVGFDRGNPLDQIIRAQLALHYHLLRDISTLYDIDGTPVDEGEDAMDEKIYNDVLDRSGFYRHKALIVPTAGGDRDLIDTGRDTTIDDGLTVRQYEEARRAGTTHLLVPTKRVRRRRGAGHKTAEVEPINDASGDIVDPSKDDPAGLTCQANGWRLNPGYSAKDTLELDGVATATPTQTLGAFMDEGVKQYQRMLPLRPKDMRLMNWHFANLEYANATNINNLSLSGWDQDIGNEFEGEHAQVIGGYQQLPYGLYSLPTKLDVRTNKIVKSISYDPLGAGKRKSVIQCEDGENFMADHIVFTGSLGVLKQRTIKFNPPLPDWKMGAIDRLGFGVMNKIVLVFDEPFWDTERDMFGLLREATTRDSMVQEDYAQNRGRFYLFWNCMKTTGLPVLIALMAGDAALQAEKTPDKDIITEVLSQLRNVFKHVPVPDPLETIITRWASDKFTYGSYSYVAANALPEDYNLMARQVGNLHFAGEATCGTHPATVHGAYISGLRAAAEVIESAVGPIEIPSPLVPEKTASNTAPAPATPAPTTPKRTITKHPDIRSTPSHSKAKSNPQPQSQSQQSSPPNKEPSVLPDKLHREAYDQALWAAIHSELGAPPPRPQKLGLNPFLLYQKDFWSICRDQCDDARRVSSNKPTAKASRNEIRHALGQMWRNASAEEKKPYLDEIEANRVHNVQALQKWVDTAAKWDERSFEVKNRWCGANPFELWIMPGSAE